MSQSVPSAEERMTKNPQGYNEEYNEQINQRKKEFRKRSTDHIVEVKLEEAKLGSPPASVGGESRVSVRKCLLERKIKG